MLLAHLLEWPSVFCRSEVYGLGGAHGIAVDLNRIVRIQRVPSGERDGEGDAGGAHALVNDVVAFAEAVHRQAEATELILAVGIGTGEVEGDLRRVCPNDPW